MAMNRNDLGRLASVATGFSRSFDLRQQGLDHESFPEILQIRKVGRASIQSCSRDQADNLRAQDFRSTSAGGRADRFNGPRYARLLVFKPVDCTLHHPTALRL